MPISARAWETPEIEFSVQNKDKRKSQEEDCKNLIEKKLIEKTNRKI